MLKANNDSSDKTSNEYLKCQLHRSAIHFSYKKKTIYQIYSVIFAVASAWDKFKL